MFSVSGEPLLGASVSYGNWNILCRELRAPYSEGEALVLWRAKKDFCVLFGSPEAPVGVLRIPDRRAWHKVTLLDEYRREVYSHLFVYGSKYGRDESWFFLEQVCKLHYPTPEAGVMERDGEVYYFKPDGSVYGRRGAHDGRVEEMESQIPPNEVETLLWDQTPDFGEWDSIVRMNRDVPLGR